ncbi:hotdog fold domain-containing protein [Actinomadura alba]|uniref:hotdog fold domain-containing protein n=1 Tax=Actinomadura alba TaxID=406431 RepID=UPI0028A96C06|nr:hotdog fold domain-containing protein [Actinomadura alba]
MVVWLLRKPYVTGRLETDHLRPVPVGATLHIRARCSGVSGRKAHLGAEARLGRPGGPGGRARRRTVRRGADRALRRARRRSGGPDPRPRGEP